MGSEVGRQRGSGPEVRFRWRPGERAIEMIALAPWLCVTAFQRLCSEQLTMEMIGGTDSTQAWPVQAICHPRAYAISRAQTMI